jgi:hypothetical protein
MKVNELRIGNLVYSRGCNNEQIESTIISLVKAGELIAMCENRFIADKPIPLTEEWLDKFGFEYDDIFEYVDFEATYSKELLDGEFLNIRIPSFTTLDIYGIELKYVHQLQNLYFALTGEELKQNVTENV